MHPPNRTTSTAQLIFHPNRVNIGGYDNDHTIEKLYFVTTPLLVRKDLIKLNFTQFPKIGLIDNISVTAAYRELSDVRILNLPSFSIRITDA